MLGSAVAADGPVLPSPVPADLELGLPLADYLGAGVRARRRVRSRHRGQPAGLPLRRRDRPRHRRPAGPAAAAARAVVEEGPESGLVASRRVEVLAPELCHRLTARVLLGVTHVASPALVRRRLTLAGMRPIDSIVDASNYVMLELGQPTHPYDLDRLAGHGLRVRAARPGEEIVTLDGVTRVLGTRPPKLDNPLAASDCLICDAEDHPVGIAGIMGGQSSEITTGGLTRAARGRATSSHSAVARTARWRRTAERGLGPVRARGGPDRHGAGGAAFLRACRRGRPRRPASIRPVVASGLLDAHPVPYVPRRVRSERERIGALLGTELEDAEIAELLEAARLRGHRGRTVPTRRRSRSSVEVPSFRPDVVREVDVAEEVARRIGYQELPESQRRSPYRRSPDRPAALFGAD